MTAESALPSQVTHAPGFQETPVLTPPEIYHPAEANQQYSASLLKPWHIELLSTWQDARFPAGEPLSRQGKQYKSELGEVGVLVFGLPTEQLDHLSKRKRKKIGDEVSDVVIAGAGKLKVLGYSYDELKEVKETSTFDPSQFSELERWQIEANGRDVPVSIRMKQFAQASLISHKAYDELGTNDEGDLVNTSSLTEDQKKDLALKVTKTMTLGLSLLNGMGRSFDEHFRRKFDKMNKKYPVERIAELRVQGHDDNEIMEICRDEWPDRKKAGEIILYDSMTPSVSQA